MAKVREVVSGGDANTQLHLEVKSMKRSEREELLRSAGFTINVPVGQGLAMKCSVGLPWNQLGELRK